MFNMAEVIVPVQFIKICTYCKAEFDSQKKLEDHHSVFHDDGCYYSSQEEDGYSTSTSEEEDSVANVSDVFIDDDRDADFHPDDEVVKRKRKAKGNVNSKLKKKAKKGKSVYAKSSKDAEMSIDNKEKDATKGRKTRKARKDHQMSKRSKNVS